MSEQIITTIRKGLVQSAFLPGILFLVMSLIPLAVGQHESGDNPSQPAPEWPQYGFDARHTMFDPGEHTLNRSNVAGLSLQWQFGEGNAISPLGGPALSDGVLYVPTQAQVPPTFMALDAATGTIRWIYTGTNFFSDPAVAYGYVYTASLDGL